VREEPCGRIADVDGPGAAPQARGAMAATSAFVDVYREAHSEMVRLAYLLTGSAETAEDLAQDAFVRLHGAFARVAEPRAYLRRSVVNACTSFHRRRFVARRRSAALVTRGTSDLGADELFDVLGTLPERQRAAIVLRYWHDLGDDEIAAALRCRPGTVGSLLHRGIARLREVIEP
jgi:RNA polymerase sigma factor (sigma-70 family)